MVGRLGFVAAMLLVAACGRSNGLRADGGAPGPTCGDGIVDPDEVCDDGNTVSGDGCSADCKSDETCGNGIVDVAAGELCDDGNNLGGDGCSADCKSDETCGNGIVDKSTGETCDDGNTVGGDGCSANCQSNETCGNNIVDPGEDCDSGNVFTATCNPDCTKPRCGDGELNMPAGETCDDGNTSDTDACTHLCKPNVCGDGFVYAGHEQCDDGNTNNNDGCRNDCTLGPGNDFKNTARFITPGTLTENIANAKDDVHPSCAAVGGKDVFFKFTTSVDEVIYVDTFNSNYDTVVAIYSGNCTNLANEIDCNDDVCGDGFSQVADSLSAGTYCIVVDQGSTSNNTSLTLTLREGGRDGQPLDFDGSGNGTVMDDLTNGGDVMQATCNPSPGPDLGYYFLGCPGGFHIDASTCGTDFDTALYLRRAGDLGDDEACNDDDGNCGQASSISADVSDGPDLFWLVVDSYTDTTPGPFTLTYTVQ